MPAYFDRGTEAPFGFIDRSTFEARLEKHFRARTTDDDPTWFALRNAIYASGSRLVLAKTTNFREASQVAWNYFSNALSAQTEMIYFQTSLTAIQALTVMVCREPPSLARVSHIKMIMVI